MTGEPDEMRGVPYWLWEEEQETERFIDRLTTDIEDLERQIVKTRDKRDEARLRVVELRVARNLVTDAGIKVERVGTDVTVSVERQPSRSHDPVLPGCAGDDLPR